MTRPLGLQGLLTLRPDNRILFSLIAGLQAILISVLLTKGETTLLVAVLLTISVSAVLFSTTGSLFVLAFFTDYSVAPYNIHCHVVQRQVRDCTSRFPVNRGSSAPVGL